MSTNTSIFLAIFALLLLLNLPKFIVLGLGILIGLFFTISLRKLRGRKNV